MTPITISSKDAVGNKISATDSVYVIRYTPDGTLLLHSCVVGKIIPAINEVQLATTGENGPETLRANPMEIYKDPVVLLERTIDTLEKMLEKTPSNILKMKRHLEEAKEGTIQKIDVVEVNQEQEI